MTPLTHKEAQDVVNAIEWNEPPKDTLPLGHYIDAEKMGLITTAHSIPFTKFITTDKAKPLIK